MRKLTIFGLIIAFAITSNAASFSWMTPMGGYVYQPGTEVLIASSTAYLLDSGSLTQSGILEAFSKGTLDLSENVDSATITNGKISSSFTDKTATGATLSAFFVTIIDDGSKQKIFISDLASAEALDAKSNTLSFDAQAASQAAAKMAADGYSGSGWYAIPEPTSGLLMLLGVAGLVLRRKQA